MGKGLSLRRRAKAVQKANEGNLHKAALGKAGASASLPLPHAPKREEFVDRVPKSLQRMMQLKAASEKQTVGKRAPVEAPQQLKGHKRKADFSGDASAAGPASDQAAEAAERPRNVADTRGLDQAEAAGIKTLKQSKKDYLNRKKLKKKAGKGAKVEQTLLEKDLAARSKVKFGERVDAPLEVNLKRKHWKAQEKTANERCKEIFLKQLGDAQRKDEALRQGLSPALPPGQQLKRHKASSSGARQLAEQEGLRRQVIEAYRARKTGPRVEQATLSSLATLVKS